MIGLKMIDSRRLARILAVLALTATAAQAQSGTFDSLSCSSGVGTASAPGQFGNTATAVDIYDGQTKILTVQTSQFANIQGTFNYSFSVPASLRDNQVHSVDARIAHTNIELANSPKPFQCAPTAPGYVYYYLSGLTSVDPAAWYRNGTATATSGGLTAPSSGGGSLISKIPVPDGSGEYEINTTLSLKASGGTFIHYLHASPDAISANSGSYDSVELYYPYSAAR